MHIKELWNIMINYNKCNKIQSISIDKICIEYKTGDSLELLANRYNCSPGLIRRHLIRNGVIIRSLSEALKVSNNIYRVNIPLSVCEEYESGSTLIDLGIKYNCHSSTIRRRLISYGVKLRSKVEVYKLQYEINDSTYTFDILRSICNEYTNGASLEVLGKKYNHTCSFIQKKLENYGIEVDRVGSDRWRRKVSATQQGISYDEWENFAYNLNSLYCPAFDDECRESNREKYGRRCFICGISEKKNVTKKGDQWKLSVHHYDMDKMQGCDGRIWKLIPLCMRCHPQAHNELWQSRIVWLLKNIWYIG